jgi:hypothetical protein
VLETKNKIYMEKNKIRMKRVVRNHYELSMSVFDEHQYAVEKNFSYFFCNSFKKLCNEHESYETYEKFHVSFCCHPFVFTLRNLMKRMDHAC